METLEPGGTELWEHFGGRLRYWRKRAGLTQAQLGAQLGYHHSQISKLESGFRCPQDALPARADELLGADGELSAIWAKIAKGRLAPTYRSNDEPTTGRGGYLLLPGLAHGSLLAGLPTASWPTRLPAQGIACPMHGYAGCAVPTPAEAISTFAEARWRSRSGTPPSGNDPDIVHSLAALLGACIAATADQTATDMVVPMESILNVIAGWAESQQGQPSLSWLRLCANYAHLTGWLRVLRGQRGIGMGWFYQGLRWAAASDDLNADVLLLINMSMLAQMERDPQSAACYARAAVARAPGRRWTTIAGYLYEARALAAAGHLARSEARLSQIQRLLGQLDERDRREAPWLTGAEGQMRVYSCLGGSLRDTAALIGGPQLGARAVAATQQALAILPERFYPARLMLTLRLADSYTCAGQPDAAIATAQPVLLEAVASACTTIAGELRGLHKRLLSGWSDLPEVREFDEQLRGL